MSNPDAVFGKFQSIPPHDPEIDPASARERLDLDQMISLIDSILPFEACLYHQVIPLSIDAALLFVGMVNPDDTAAIDYVKRQIAYINYSLVSLPIASDWHREMLSKYLSHKAKAKPTPPKSSLSNHSSASQPPPSLGNSAEQATFIVDSPSTIPIGDHNPGALANAEKANVAPTRSPDYDKNRQGNLSARLNTAEKCDHNQPLELNLPASSPNFDLSTMGKLPPKQLMQALLTRVLQDGIGRLYFERRETVGRILWSKDGIVQAALEDLPLPLLQSVMNEFKRLTHVPLLPTTESKQVEIERLYRQERVMLRFRLIASTHGEEATLQVLRGAALKFYQQQQIDQLGRKALTFAHRLKEQISQIQERSSQTITLEGMPATTLTAISHLLKDIDTEINRLIPEVHQQD